MSRQFYIECTTSIFEKQLHNKHQDKMEFVFRRWMHVKYAFHFICIIKVSSSIDLFMNPFNNK